jgi:hypothetical protein
MFVTTLSLYLLCLTFSVKAGPYLEKEKERGDREKDKDKEKD